MLTQGIVMPLGKLPFLQTSDGEHYFPDLETPHDPNSARNGNQGLKQGYFIFRLFPITSLNGHFWPPCFRITDILAGNPK
jgi:hypothetical protein